MSKPDPIKSAEYVFSIIQNEIKLMSQEDRRIFHLHVAHMTYVYTNKINQPNP